MLGGIPIPEGIAVLILIALILWVCSGETGKQSQFSIQGTPYEGFFEVRESETGETKFVGTWEQCEEWITGNGA